MSDSSEKIKSQINDSIKIKQTIVEDQNLIFKIEVCCKIIISAFKDNKKVLIAGNGGSAADAQHMAGEFVSRFNFDRPGLPAISLVSDSSIVTSISNDYGYEKLFERQLQSLAQSGDVFIALTTSGKSKNILKAVKYCHENSIMVISLTGSNISDLTEFSDVVISVPSNHTPRIQEAHILIGHIICSIVEETMFARGI